MAEEDIIGIDEDEGILDKIWDSIGSEQTTNTEYDGTYETDED